MRFDPEKFRKHLKTARKKKHMTQEQLADALNISYSHLSKIESGSHTPSLDLVIEMALILEVSIDYLVLGPRANNRTVKMRLSAIAHAIQDLIDIL